VPSKLLLLAPILGLTSCSQPKTPWWEQVQSGGPCHEANLMDGLDTESGEELRNIAYCLNQHGNLDAVMPLVESTRELTRDGREAGQHLALGLNGLLNADINVFQFSTQLLDWMESDSGLLDAGLKVLVELTYGLPYVLLENQPAPTAQSALDQGVITPLLGGFRAGLIAALDADLAPLETAESALNSPRTLSLIHSLAGMLNSPDTGFKHRTEDLLEDLGYAIKTAQSPNNDRTASATGDSLRDLITALAFNRDATGQRAIDLVELAAEKIFSDTVAQGRVRTALEGLVEKEALRSMPLQLRYLGTVDSRGSSLGPGDDSALVSMLRLLNNSNTSINCSIPWGFSSYEISLGNLALALLEGISELDPELSADGIDLLAGILGLPLSDAILQTVAALGVCPVLDAQFADDLQSLDRLNDAGSGDLLRVLIQVLKALGQGQDSRIPEMVELLSIPDAVGASEPLEELLRDWGGTAFLESMAAFSNPILNPSSFVDDSGFPSDVTPIDFDDLWEILETAFDSPNSGKSPLRQLEPLVLALLEQEDTWIGVHALGSLLSDHQSVSQDLLSWLPEIVALDPDLNLTRTLAGVLFQKETASHFAQALEVDALFQAATKSSESQQGPLPFFAQLQLSGTLETLLGTIDRVFGLLVPPQN
jgi:hypothetical protein